MVFQWSLSDSKSPRVSRTLLSILAVLNNIVVWMVSSHPPIIIIIIIIIISNSSVLCVFLLLLIVVFFSIIVLLVIIIGSFSLATTYTALDSIIIIIIFINWVQNYSLVKKGRNSLSLEWSGVSHPDQRADFYLYIFTLILLSFLQNFFFFFFLEFLTFSWLLIEFKKKN